MIQGLNCVICNVLFAASMSAELMGKPVVTTPLKLVDPEKAEFSAEGSSGSIQWTLQTKICFVDKYVNKNVNSFHTQFTSVDILWTK
jgi:hypothetical protein